MAVGVCSSSLVGEERVKLVRGRRRVCGMVRVMNGIDVEDEGWFCHFLLNSELLKKKR